MKLLQYPFIQRLALTMAAYAALVSVWAHG